MTKRQGKSGTIDVKALLSEDEEFLRALVRTALQEVLEAEMTEALGAEKGERAAGRQGYRSGYYGRTLITRVGHREYVGPCGDHWRTRRRTDSPESSDRRLGAARQPADRRLPRPLLPRCLLGQPADRRLPRPLLPRCLLGVKVRPMLPLSPGQQSRG